MKTDTIQVRALQLAYRAMVEPLKEAVEKEYRRVLTEALRESMGDKKFLRWQLSIMNKKRTR